MKYTNKFGLPQSIVDAIQKDTYDVNRIDPNVISVTTLIKPPRIRQLTLRHWDEIEEDVSSNVWRLLGSAIHTVLERVDDKGRVIEKRLREEIGGKVVTGRPDLYGEKEKVITDYKITSCWKFIFMDKEEVYECPHCKHKELKK